MDSVDTNNYDEPTLPWQARQAATEAQAVGQDITQALPVASPPGVTTPPVAQRRKWSRRKLIGVAAAGVGAATIGGVALAEVLQHGGLNFAAHGPIASNMQIGHLLRKAGFGASPQDLAIYQKLSFQDAVDRLLNYQQVSESETENRLNALGLQLDGRTAIADQQRWWLLRMAWTQRPLLEKMTLFWHGVLTSSWRKAGGPNNYGRMILQNQFLRTHAFDTFDNLLLGITADPAMLFYLDLTKSRKNAPNENYARELMELFTIGLSSYTQQDVFGGAAALTGWHVVGQGMQSVGKYFPGDHNALVKNFLGQRGNFDYKDIIHLLTNHPAAPWFIARKLFTFFVYENPTNADLSPLVDTYVKSGHNIGAVMRTLLLSPQFASQQAYRSRVKSPVEFVVGAYRGLGVQGNGKNLGLMTTLMGQTLFDPPNVAGWPGDKVSALWLNSGTWMTRLNYVDLLLVNRNPASGYQPIDLQAVVDANKIDTPQHFIDYHATFLLDGNLSSDRQNLLLSYFSANASSRGNAKITLGNGKSYPLGNVRGALYLMLSSPEYQLN